MQLLISKEDEKINKSIGWAIGYYRRRSKELKTIKPLVDKLGMSVDDYMEIEFNGIFRSQFRLYQILTLLGVTYEQVVKKAIEHYDLESELLHQKHIIN